MRFPRPVPTAPPRRIPALLPAGLLAAALALGACGRKDAPGGADAAPEDKEALAAIIAGFSGGALSADGPVKVAFVNPVADSGAVGRVLEENPFVITPKLAGTAIWADARTLEFRPAERLERGREYRASLRLDRLMEVPGRLARFTFAFSAMAQHFEAEAGGLETADEEDLRWMRAPGVLRLADGEDAAAVERMLVATQDGRRLPVRWEHRADGREHPFRVDSLRRGEDSSRLVLAWSGTPVGTGRSEADTLIVPSLHDFRLLSVEAVPGPERYVSVRFSDPPRRGLDFRGLIEVPEQGGLRYEARRNEVRVYSAQEWSGSRTVRIAEGIRDAAGKPLLDPRSARVVFEEVKPGVRFAGKGVILPGEGDLALPFEAVNLRSVKVTVLRIHAGNVPQFLQVNDLDGQNELRRVGRPVLSRIVALDPAPTMRARWARYALDLSDLRKLEAAPGTLWRVELSFRRGNSTYPCPDSAAAGEEDQALRNWDEDRETEASGWDGIEEYYQDGEYEWSDRENPCTPSYYRYGREAARNFLASDIGLMAKMAGPAAGRAGAARTARLHVVATSLLTAAPLAGADLEVLDFQHQAIGRGRTDDGGFAEVELPGRPFLLKASKGEQRGYLKIDDPSALQMGGFDAGGQPVQEGLKGFLFGERGVWRPGDSLHLTFVLEDRQGRLPAGHPLAFELRDPRGQVVRSLTRASGGAFYAFATATDPDAPTGQYLARVRAGPAVFEERLKVETVIPNRLRIRAAFAPKPLVRGQPVRGSLDVSWLSGAVARHLDAEVEMTLQAAEPDFAAFKDYAFADPARKFEPETQVLFRGRVDGEGRAAFSQAVKVEGSAPGALRADFRIRVFEAGGAASVDRSSEAFHPYHAYLGIRLPPGDRARGMLLTDTTHSVRLVALDPEGRRLPRRRAQVRLSKLDWRWWWEEDGSQASYVHDQGRDLLQEDTVTLAGGEATWGLKVRYPDWGRYLVRVCDLDAGRGEGGGHCTGRILFMDWPGWAGRAQRDGAGGGAAILATALDKEKYRVGEKVRLTIPSPRGGRALVSLEKGGTVYRRQWVDLAGKETVHEFEAEAGMAPNVYLYVALLQPHGRTENDLPIRMYNVLPVHVEDPATRLAPRLRAEPEVFRPGAKASVVVSEQAGRPMQYVVAVVDEGLLDLTRFRTPDPHGRFYAREALGMRTWDLFDHVAGAYGSRLERLLPVGGDEDVLKAPQGRKGNRFPPMVKYLGPFTLGKGATARHTFEVPQYVGSVRAMVVAGGDGAYGNAERAVPVRKPLMVLGTLPRVLSPGEAFKLPVSVFAMEKHVRDVEVEVAASGPVRVEGERRRTLAFREPADDVVAFDLATGDAVGWAKVTIRARSGSERAEQTLEIEVRNPNRRVTGVAAGLVQPGAAWSHAFRPFGAAGTNRAVLKLSRLPALDLGKRLGYLIQYPHGCAEQVVSAAFPQLHLDALMDLPAAYKADVERNVKAAIRRLRGFQGPGGGFGFWPGDPDPNDWASTYAGHFLVEAGKKGYGIPAGMLDQWKRHQGARARGWSPAGGPVSPFAQMSQAYRLYALALAGAAEMGAMNRLKETPGLSLQARWQLGGAYQLAGQPEAAASLVRGDPAGVKPYRELDGTFGTDLRDKAMMLEVLAMMGRRAEAAPLMQEVAAALGGPDVWPTQTTAQALLAMSRYAGRAFDRGEEARYGLALNGSGSEGGFAAPLLQQALRPKEGEDNRLEVRNRGRELLYARLILEGVPPPGGERAEARGLSLAVEYKTPNGTPVDPARLEQGQDIVAEATVSHGGGAAGELRQLALTMAFPSGWEIRNTRLDPAGSAAERAGGGPPPRASSPFEYQDFRDDRVHTYFHLGRGEARTFRFFLNAAYLGRYRMPQSGVEAMYDPGIYARTAGGAAEVHEGGSGAGAPASSPAPGGSGSGEAGDGGEDGTGEGR